MITKKVKPTPQENRELNRYEIVERVGCLTHSRFDGKKWKRGMDIKAACAELGFTGATFHRWLREDAVLKRMWDEIREDQKDSMVSKAMENVEAALYGDVRLRPSEQINVSLRFLEKVSDKFKDKVELETKPEWAEFWTSLEELQKRANEIMGKIRKEYSEPTETDGE